MCPVKHEKNRRVPSRHLSDRDIEQLVCLLDAWKSAPLTWHGLVAAASDVLGFRPARQTLYRKARIRIAYKSARERVASPAQKSCSLSISAAREKISRLEAELFRLKAENNALLCQFVVWRYNAYARGISDVDLNKPLPVVNRGRTV